MNKREILRTGFESWMQIENNRFLKSVDGECAVCEGLLCLWRVIFSYQRLC